MTWKKASPVLIVGGIFDALRYFFLMFWLFGPALVGLYCTAKVGDTAVIGGALTAVCVTGAAALGFGGSAVFIAFGTIMAIAVGFAGWFAVTFFIAATNSRALGENPLAIIWLFEGLGASVFIMAWGIYRTQIQKERAALKKYEAEQAAQQQQEQNQRMAELAWARAGQLDQGSEQEEEEAAEPEEEIPEEIPEAA